MKKLSDFKNFRNTEVIHTNPTIIYMEADFVNANVTDWEKNYGYGFNVGNELWYVFSADRSPRLKEIFKSSILKQYKFER